MIDRIINEESIKFENEILKTNNARYIFLYAYFHNVKNKKKLYDFEINKMQYIEDIINMLNNGVVGHKHYNIFLIFLYFLRSIFLLFH